MIAPLAGRDGIWFDLLVGGLDHDEYEQLDGDHETLAYDEETGELRFAKVIQLDGGTVTVETAYERAVAA